MIIEKHGTLDKALVLELEDLDFAISSMIIGLPLDSVSIFSGLLFSYLK